MSFQNIIDRAAEIIMNTQGVVAQTATRDGTIRSVSRGGQPWVFTVQLPEGPRWTDYRAIISAAERYDRHTEQDISFDATGHSYLFGYQGDLTAPNANGSFNGDWSSGFDTFTMTGGTGSGNRVVAGDFVQLGANGHVYKVVTTTTGNTVRVHRPILESSGTGDVFVGADCTFTVKASQFAQPRMFGYNQVGWTGPFVFVEVID